MLVREIGQNHKVPADTGRGGAPGRRLAANRSPASVKGGSAAALGASGRSQPRGRATGAGPPSGHNEADKTGCPPLPPRRAQAGRHTAGRPGLCGSAHPSATPGASGPADWETTHSREPDSRSGNLTIFFPLLFTLDLAEVGPLGSKGLTRSTARAEPCTWQGAGISAQVQTPENQCSRPLPQNCWKNRGKASLLNKQH